MARYVYSWCKHFRQFCALETIFSRRQAQYGGTQRNRAHRLRPRRWHGCDDFFRFKAGPGASFAPPTQKSLPMNCVGPRSRWRRTKGASLQHVQGRRVLPNYLPLCATGSPPLPRTGASGLRFSYRRSAIKRSSSVVMLFPPLYQSRSSGRAEKRLGAQKLPESAAFGARTINSAATGPSVHTHGSRP